MCYLHVSFVDPILAFLCQDLSKQNSARKGKKQNCRQGEVSTGVTLKAVIEHCRRRRPKITFLENVTEIEQQSSFNEETEACMCSSRLCVFFWVSYVG